MEMLPCLIRMFAHVFFSRCADRRRGNETHALSEEHAKITDKLPSFRPVLEEPFQFNPGLINFCHERPAMVSINSILVIISVSRGCISLGVILHGCLAGPVERVK